MHKLILGLSLAGAALGGSLEDFVAAAQANHGELGRRAAQFLVDHMPPADRETVSVEFLSQNLDLAFRARGEFPWATQVPEPIFINDVLPYAVFDERRDPWREELYRLGRELVQDARTGSEAAQALNRQLFDRLKVHYNTGRRRPNQSLQESKASGKATCTGLSIILVNACRAVGVPARAVGTPRWANGRGNHTWVEVWDGDWHFTGADEYNAAGLDRGWFAGDAAQAQAEVAQHAIYATSWRREGLTFPMVWSRRSEAVAAVNVTARYVRRSAEEAETTVRLGVRLWDRRNGDRISAKFRLMDSELGDCGLGETKSGRADLNDLPRVDLKPGFLGWLRFSRGKETRELSVGPLQPGESTVDAVWDEMRDASVVIDALQAWLAQPVEGRSAQEPALRLPLTRSEAEQVLQLVAKDRLERIARKRAQEIETRTVVLHDRTMRWLEKTFGDPPPEGHSLWISLHGGGNTRAAVNDRQWRNQGGLYELEEGIYVAPRAPTDTWNLWHEGHIDPLFEHLIETYVAVRGVNPDRVYLLGYSAGGDGVWQLAPRMADSFAAAAMMAGHPNEASLLGLRNLPFAILVGGEDSAYDRNQVAAQRAVELDRLARDDPGGYVHLARIYEGMGHWMNGKDAEALPWMAGFKREPWPIKIVWQQDDIVHRRFYWLQVPETVSIGERSKIVAEVKGQTVEVNGDVPAVLCVRLSDRLLDLDEPLLVRVNGREAFSGLVPRQAVTLLASLTERSDPATAACAGIRLALDADAAPKESASLASPPKAVHAGAGGASSGSAN